MKQQKPTPIRCSCCKRKMEPGDTYYVVDNQIVCNRFECGSKAGRWEVYLLPTKKGRRAI